MFSQVLRLLWIVIMTVSFASASFAASAVNIPILCYHNLNPTLPGSMNMTPKKFEAQLQWIKDNGYTFIPLRHAVEYLQGKRDSLPPKAVVITADDGWQSVYTYMYPVARKLNVPITLFIYPQTISEGKNAMTWEQLKELQQTGLFDIQSHTDWHPNFKKEKRKLSQMDYANFVKRQMVHSKRMLEDKLGTKITLLAWPFGIYDDFLEQQAAAAGYEMAFTIDARSANRSFRPMAQPRYMIVDGLSMQTFTSIIGTANSKSKVMSAKKSN